MALFSFIDDSRWGELDDTQKESVLGIKFDKDVASDERFKNLTPEKQIAAKEIYFDKAKNYEEYSTAPEERGILSSAASHFGRGVVEAIGTAGTVMEMADLKPRVVDKEEGIIDTMARGVTDWTEKALKKYPSLRPDKSELEGKPGFVERGVMSGIESLPLTGSVFAGAGAGLLVGGPIGAAAGGLATLVAMFGVGQYGQEYKSVYEEVSKNPNVSEEEKREMAHRVALGSSLFEVGTELPQDLLALYTFGGSTVLTTPITATLKKIATTPAKSLMKSGLKQMGGEVTGEMVAGGGQAWMRQREGILSGPSIATGVVESIIPAMVMTLGIGTGMTGFNRAQSRSALKQLNSDNIEERTAAVNMMADRIAVNTKDISLASTWRQGAEDALQSGEKFDINEKLVDFASVKMAEDIDAENVKTDPIADISKAASADEAIKAFEFAVTAPERKSFVPTIERPKLKSPEIIEESLKAKKEPLPLEQTPEVKDWVDKKVKEAKPEPKEEIKAPGKPLVESEKKPWTIAKEARKRGDLTVGKLNEGVSKYKGKGGIASENKSLGFEASFRDKKTGEIIPSLDGNGRKSTIHLLDGMPEKYVTERNKEHGDVIAVSSDIEPGFTKDGKFYTREEAVTEIAKPKAPPITPEKAPEAKAKEDGARREGESTDDWLDRLTGGKKISKADKLRKEADKIGNEANAMLDGIPAGQPINSTRDRNLREKSGNKMQKARELYDKADLLEAEEAKPPEVAKAKEAWEKPQSEFLLRKPKEFPSATEKSAREMAIGVHKKAIERALKEGKPVPESVLKDYPELKADLPSVETAIKPPPKKEAVSTKKPTPAPEKTDVALKAAEVKTEPKKKLKAPKSKKLIGENLDGDDVYEDEKGRYTLYKGIKSYAPRPVGSAGGKLTPKQPEELYRDLSHGYLTKDEVEGFYNRRDLPSFDHLEKLFKAKKPLTKPEKADTSKTDKKVDIGTPDNINSIALSQVFLDEIKKGTTGLTKIKLRSTVADIFGMKPNELQKTTGFKYKPIEEAFEYAIVNRARDIISSGTETEDIYNQLKELYENQPSLSTRTSTSIENQAYSTPVHLAYLIQELAGVNKKSWIYEPTAGTGMLLTSSDPSTSWANELDRDRLDFLTDQGFLVSNLDGAKAVQGKQGHPRPKAYDAVTANPPFGSTQKTDIKGYRISKIEHAIMMDALDGMKDDGKAAFIIGGKNFDNGVMNGTQRTFLNWLHNNYHVFANIDIPGDAYSRQGSSFPIRVIVINGRKSKKAGWAPKDESAYQKVESIDEILPLLKEIKDGKNLMASKRTDEVGGSEEGAGPSDTGKGEGKLEELSSVPSGQVVELTEEVTEPTTDATKPDEVGAGESGTETGRPFGTAPVGRPPSKPEQPGGTVSAIPPQKDDIRETETAPGLGDTGATGITETTQEGTARPDTSGVSGTGSVDDVVNNLLKLSENEAEKERIKTKRDEGLAQIKEGIKKFNDLFGEEGSIKISEDQEIDPAKWPQFQDALQDIWEGFKKVADSIKDAAELFIKDAYSKLSTKGKPYIDKFINENIRADLENEQAPKSPSKPKIPKPEETGFQTTYHPKSDGPIIDETLMPRKMYESVNKALDNLEQEVGNIDDYVRGKLEYKSNKALFNALSGDQVDAAALAINNIDKGMGMIIGDQTGVGKGRVAAAIYKYAQIRGLKPIFFTEKPNLFSDFYRDIVDIGHDFNPFIMASNAKLANIIDKDDNTIFLTPKPAERRRILQGMASDGISAIGNKDGIITTYSQINKLNNPPQQALANVAPGNMVIMDESHNASGVSNTGMYLRGILANVDGVVYLSATFAKRPDTMPIYYKTAMSRANLSMEQLVSAIDSGGTALQEIVSNNLARLGQYIRREKSFEGVEVSSKVDSQNRVRDERRADQMTEILRDIIDFDAVAGAMLEDIQDDINSGDTSDIHGIPVDGAEIVNSRPVTASVNHSNFTSVVHNAVRQLLLSMKADTAVKTALAELKAGRKPIIAVSNTMETFLKDQLTTGLLTEGESFSMNFPDVLERHLRRTLQFRVQQPNGDTVRGEIPVSELSPEHREMYDAVVNKINKAMKDLPGSPIDHIKQKITQAGYNVEEITGRTWMADLSDPDNPTLKARSGSEKAMRNQIMSRFNNGGTDVLVVNSAGATGASLHTSPHFKDLRPRTYIGIQAELNIDTEVQKMGRINRKGQVNLPKYTSVYIDIPTEIRPAAVLMGKLRSLSATTSANADSPLAQREFPDMMNRYGDRVAREWAAENSTILQAMGLELDNADFKRVSGRMALMPVEVQRAFFDNAEDEYNSLIEDLKQEGTYDLEVEDINFKAKTISKELMTSGSDESNPFGESTWREELSVVMPKKPLSLNKIQKLVQEKLKGRPEGTFVSEFLKDLSDDAQSYLDSKKGMFLALDTYQALEEQTETSLNRINNVLDDAVLGKKYGLYNIPNMDRMFGILIDVKLGKGRGNPAAPSRTKLIFAVDNALQKYSIPLSKLDTFKGYNQGIRFEEPYGYGKDISDWDDNLPKDVRDTRYIITGNLLQGSADAPAASKIIRFTMENGEVREGILTPMNYKAGQENTNVRMTPEEAIKIVEGGSPIRGSAVDIRPVLYNDKVTIAVPKSKQRGGVYFLDPELRGLTETGDFESVGNEMRASIPRKNIAAVIRRVYDLGDTFSVHRSMYNEAFDNRGEVGSGSITDTLKNSLGNERGSSQLATDIYNYAFKLAKLGINKLSTFSKYIQKRFSNIWDKIKPHIKALFDVVNNQRGEIKIGGEEGKKPDTDAFEKKVAKEKPTEFGSKKDSPPPTDPKLLDGWLKDMTDLTLKTLVYHTPRSAGKIIGEKIEKRADKKGKEPPKLTLAPHFTMLEKLTTSPEWSQHPTMQKLVRIFIRDRKELFHQYFNYVNETREAGDVVKTLKDLKHKGLSLRQRIFGKSSKEYESLADMIDDVDINWKRDQKLTLEEHYEKVAEHYKAKGVTDEVTKAWLVVRKSYDRSLQLRRGEMEKMISKLAPAGPRSELKEIKFGEKSTINYGIQYLEDVDKLTDYKTVTHKTAIMWGLPYTEGIHYVKGKFKDSTDVGIQAIKFNKEKFTETSANKWWSENRQRISIRLKESERERVKKLKETLQGYLAVMGDLEGTYAPRQRDQGNWAIQAHKAEGGGLRTHRQHRGSFLSAQRYANKLKKEGWTVKEPEEFPRLPEAVYQDIKTIAVAQALNEANKRLEKEGMFTDELTLSFNQGMLEHISDLVKERGYRGGMIHRRAKGIVEGYNRDPLERFLIDTNSLAGGLSKAKVAEMATKEILGSWEDGVKVGGIDAATEPRAYEVATSYLQEQLRNTEQIDRWIGLAKSVTTFKYLGFNLRSLGVNLTAMMTTAPAAIHQYALGGKVSFAEIGKELGKAGNDYARFMAGKKVTDRGYGVEKFLNDMKRRGHDDPQYTREALGNLRSPSQKVWPAMMDASMWAFGKSEEWNRGATQLAAFRLVSKQLVESGKSLDEAYEIAVDRSKEASDKAHATYGKATYPVWAMGKNPFAQGAQLFYMYSKFGHNYVQMCYDLGMRKHNIKAFAWAALSPLVLAGAAAFPFKDEIFWFFGGILKALGITERDPEKWVWDQTRRYLGDKGELIARHGITGALGVDISGSLSIGIGVPKGLLDLTGAAGGVVEDVMQAGRFARTRQYGRAVEKVIPRGLENPLRALRESKTGLVTQRGKRLFTAKGKPYMPSPAESVARIAGFRSASEATISERTWESKRQEKTFSDRKSRIYEAYRAYIASKDRASRKEVMEMIRDYNRSIKGVNVPKVTLQSLRRQARRMNKPTKRERGRLQ